MMTSLTALARTVVQSINERPARIYAALMPPATAAVRPCTKALTTCGFAAKRRSGNTKEYSGGTLRKLLTVHPFSAALSGTVWYPGDVSIKSAYC